MKRGNTVSIKGNVTRDVEIRRTSSGANACTWGIAWNDARKDDNGQWEDVPNFFEVQCWASDAQLKYIEGITKGARCAVISGHLEYQTWSKDGSKFSKVIIRVDDPVSGLMVEAGRQKAPTRNEPQAPIEVEASIYDDEIPF